MLKCAIKASTLSNAMKLCSSVHQELTLTANAQGIDLSSNLDFEFIWVTIPFDSFKDYDLSEPLEFSLDSREIVKILSKFKDSEINLELTKERCKISFSKDKSAKAFNLRVLDPTYHSSDSDKKASDRARSIFTSDNYKSFGTEFTFPSKELYALVDDMMMEESIQFILDKDKLTLSQDDQTRGSSSSSQTIKGSIFEHIQSKFNYSRIASITEILSKMDIQLEMRFKQDAPLMIRYFGELQLRYALAPLVSND